MNLRVMRQSISVTFISVPFYCNRKHTTYLRECAGTARVNELSALWILWLQLGPTCKGTSSCAGLLFKNSVPEHLLLILDRLTGSQNQPQQL
jgi:hypothetical protein